MVRHDRPTHHAGRAQPQQLPAGITDPSILNSHWLEYAFQKEAQRLQSVRVYSSVQAQQIEIE